MKNFITFLLAAFVSSAFGATLMVDQNGKFLGPGDPIKANNLVQSSGGGLVAPLTPGAGLSGDIFNGAQAQTWQLDTAWLDTNYAQNLNVLLDGSLLLTNSSGESSSFYNGKAAKNLQVSETWLKGLEYLLILNETTKAVADSADARKFKDSNTIGDYSGLYVFVDTYGGGAVPYKGATSNYINAPTTRDWGDWGIKYASSIYNATLTTVGAQSINGSFANTITDAASTQNAVLTPIVSGNVNANTIAVQNFRIQNTSYPITGTFSLTESGGSAATAYTGSLTPNGGRIAMDLLSGKFTGNISGTQNGTYANTINANTALTGNLAIPVNSASRLFLQGVASTNVQNAYKYVSEYFTDLVLKVISPAGEVLYCMTTSDFNVTPLTSLYPSKVDRNAKVYYYTNGTYVNASGKTVEAPKKLWNYVNGQVASNGTRYWSIGEYETLGGNQSAPYYKIRITGIEVFPDMTKDWVREAFADPRNTIKVWRSHGVYGAEYVGIRNNDPTYQDSTAPIWRPAKTFYTKPAN